jgi:putative transposase
MARPARRVTSDGYYHVLNRGNGRMTLFHNDGDYLAFVRVLFEALARYPVDLLDWCLMPNHWHLVLSPRRRDALAGLMRWVGVTHVRRHHEHYRSRGGGHLYQGRFKSFPVQDDGHFLTVCRYVESNPLRAGLVRRAEAWPWSGLGWRDTGEIALGLAKWPVDKPSRWVALVNEQMPDRELDRLKVSVARGRPFGRPTWIAAAAKRLGLMSSLRPIGRPRKKNNQ